MTHSETGSEKFSIKDILAVTRNEWKFIVVFIFVGGLIGFGLTYLIKPEYEAVSVFSFSFDFARTGLLTDIEEDHAMEVVGDLLNSTGVQTGVIERVSELGQAIAPEELKNDFTAERRFGQWLLKVRREDASEAARLANIWGEASRSALINAQTAAGKADSLHRYILSLENCYQQTTSLLPAQPLCQSSNRIELQQEIEASGVDLTHWRELSQGFFPGLNFSWVQEAEVPTSPVQHARGNLILSGCLIGLLTAWLILLFKFKI